MESCSLAGFRKSHGGEDIRPTEATAVEPCLTRFVPGRIGRGFTDDLDALAGDMVSTGKVALDHHYGLWYHRRREITNVCAVLTVMHGRHSMNCRLCGVARVRHGME